MNERTNWIQIALAALIIAAGVMFIRWIAKGGIFKGIADAADWAGDKIEAGGEWVMEQSKDGAQWVWKNSEKGAALLEEGAEKVWNWMEEIELPDFEIPNLW